MELVFRALGLAASANQALSRHRVNFVPSNWIIAGVAVAILVFNVQGYMEAARNGRDPQAVALNVLSGSAEGSFVKTKGTLHPTAGFQYGETDSNGSIKRVTMELVPLVDEATGQAVIVQLPAQHRFGSAPREIEISGMLRPMQAFLTNELRQTNFDLNGVRVLPGRVLVGDDTPGEAGAWQLGMALSGAVVGLFLLLTFKRNVIFVPGASASAPVSASAETAGEVYATGTFTLDKHSARFISVPSAVSRLDNGDFAALANVDASSTFMGMKYRDRTGVWMMHMAAGSIEKIQEGVLYFGRRATPAVKFQYRDGISSRTRTAILSVPVTETRANVVAELTALRRAA